MTHLPEVDERGMQHLTGLERDLLYIVCGSTFVSESNIIQELNKYFPKDVMEGRVVPRLETLTENGLIEREEKNRVRRYAITPEGCCLLQDHREWENSVLYSE